MMKNLKFIATLLLVLAIVCMITATTEAATPGNVNWQTCPQESSKRTFIDIEASKDEVQRKEKLLLKKLLKSMENRHEGLAITQDQIDEMERIQGMKAKRSTKYKTTCASVKVPLLWDNTANSKTVTFFVKRFERTKPSEKKQTPIWLLQGGPGGSGHALYSIAELLLRYYETNDKLNPVFYVPDQRGTGKGTYLMCNRYINVQGQSINVQVGGPFSASLQRQCWNDIVAKYPRGELKGFGTTNAARDVLYVIDKEEQRARYGVAATVYGVSYGTYWLNRILDVQEKVYTKTLVDRTIADSVVNAGMNFLDRDLHFEEAAKVFMESCQSSKECLGRFHEYSTTEDMMKGVYNKMELGTCVSDVKPQAVARFASAVIANNDNRRLIFPIFYRYYRCNEEDKQFLTTFQTTYLSSFSGTKRILPAFALYEGAENDLNQHKNHDEDAVKMIQAAEVNAFTSNDRSLLIPEQERSNSNLLALVALSEITKRTGVHPASYWANRQKSFPPYIYSSLSQMLTNTYEIVKNNLYTESAQGTYSKYTGSMLTLYCNTDPQTPPSFAKDWMSHYKSSAQQTFEYPNCVHAAIISTSFTVFNQIRYRLPFAGMYAVTQYFEGENPTNLKKAMFDYEFQFTQSLNYNFMNTFFKSVKCSSLYDGCSGPSLLYPALGGAAMVFLCCCCCVCLLACLGLLCKPKKKKNSGNKFVKFTDQEGSYPPVNVTRPGPQAYPAVSQYPAGQQYVAPQPGQYAPPAAQRYAPQAAQQYAPPAAQYVPPQPAGYANNTYAPPQANHYVPNPRPY